MKKIDLGRLWEIIPDIMKYMTGAGTLLAVQNEKESNFMTIGWAQFGYVWGRYVTDIFVRPSRYTYDVLKKTDSFTINVLSDTYKNVVNIGGSQSGHKINKWEKSEVHQEEAETVSGIRIAESLIVIEAKVITDDFLSEERLPADIINEYYQGGDYHKVLTGQIHGIFIS